MTEDRYLGVACCCIPRRVFVGLLAVVIFVYSLVDIVYITLYRWPLVGGAPSTSHCHGHRCYDVLTCQGSREATFHLREVVQVLGGAVFGYWGFHGAFNGYVEELRRFAWFLSAMAVLLTVIMFFDGAYFLLCEAYPTHVVYEALMWSFPNFPVRDAVKNEVANVMTEYPVGFISHLTSGVNVWRLYMLTMLPIIVLWVYAGDTAYVLADLSASGIFGMGPHYDIRNWREDAIMRKKIREKVKETARLARETVRDVGWQPPKKYPPPPESRNAAAQGNTAAEGYGAVDHA